MAIKQNEVAQIKASHEDVFILSINPDGTALVRRPTGTQNGVIHLTETFTLPELETQDEARTRELAERFSLQQKFATLSGNPPNDAPASMQ